MNFKLYIILVFIILSHEVNAQIVVDGQFDDWSTINDLESDNDNNAGASGIDFSNVKVSSDSEYLYLFFDTNKEINLQDQNKITVYIDTDNNPSTGLPKSGIGADLEYRLGDRYGVFYKNGNTTFFEHPSVGLISAPTVTSESFELLFRRDAFVNGSAVFSNASVKILLKDEISSGDEVPNSQGGMAYTFDDQEEPNIADFSFGKTDSELLRIMTYNVRRDDLFESSKYAAYSRIFKATQPDIIAIQEVYDHSSLQVRNIISQMMGISSSNFFYDDVNSDVHLVSRYPIEASVRVDGNGFFLLDKNGLKILVCVAHLPCCENNFGRQDEIDRIMSFIRNAKNGTASITLPNESPIVILGDMNLVGDKRQVETLLTGDIFYSQNGQDFDPDWDGSHFEDALVQTTGIPAAVTWNNTFSDFAPGRLDYLVYSGSVMDLENAFVLNTAALSQDDLQDSQLQLNDSEIASDHFPIIGDFRLAQTTSITSIPDWVSSVRIADMGNGQFKMTFDPTVFDEIGVRLFDVLGREKAISGHEKFAKDNLIINLKDESRGLYFIEISNKNRFYTFKLMHK